MRPRFRQHPTALGLLLVSVVVASQPLHAQQIRIAPTAAPAFLENRGQFTGGAGHVVTTTRFTLHVGTAGIVLTPRTPIGPGRPIRLALQGDRSRARLSPVERLPGRMHFLRGRDPAGWVTNLPRHAGLRIDSALPGLDLTVRLVNPGGAVKPSYSGEQLAGIELRASPGQDRISWSCEGHSAMVPGVDGALRIDTESGPLILRLETPVGSGPAAGGTPWNAAASPRPALEPEGADGFHIDAPGAGTDLLTLTLDASGFLGTPCLDEAFGVAVREVAAGTSAFICGWSAASAVSAASVSASVGATAPPASTSAPAPGPNPGTSVPLSGGPVSWPTTCPRDAFVARFDAETGQLDWLTAVGGADDDVALDLHVDALGRASIVGLTTSGDDPLTGFPTTQGAFDTTANGSCDAFVLTLDRTGRRVLSATFLGGSDSDLAYGLDRDASGALYVAGQTASNDFPVLGAPVNNSLLNGTGLRGNSDGFVVKLLAGAGSLAYATYVTGDNCDACTDIVVDSALRAHVCGNTNSFVIAAKPFPFSTVPGFDDLGDGVGDSGFCASLNATGSAFVHRTFLEGPADDSLNDIAVDAAGLLYLAGYSASPQFPVTGGAYQSTLLGPSDSVLCKLDPGPGTLLYSTFLGGGEGEVAWGLALAGSDRVCLTGSTLSGDFPVTSGAPQASAGGAGDAWVALLDLAQSGAAALLASTFLGGSGADAGYAVATDSLSRAHCTGFTESGDLPAGTGVFDPTYNGKRDAFLALLALP